MSKGITLIGGRNAQNLLKAMQRLADEKEMRKHMRKGAKPIQKEAVQNAKLADDSGELGQAIGIIDDPDDATGVILHPRRSKRFKKGYIAHIVEYGADPHLIKPKKGKVLKMKKGGFVTGGISHPGVDQKPFMRPAWDVKKQEAEMKIAASLKKDITRKSK
jgi:hypothetical protein